jgi:uncharacterized protein
MKTEGSAQFLRIHIGENDRYQGRPLHQEILARCRACGAEQASVYRGIEGYGASTLIHRPHWFSRSKDAPIVVTILADTAAMERLRPQLEEIVDEGLIALSAAEIIRYEEETTHVAD